LNSVEDTLVECQLNIVETIQSLSFHLWCSVFMENSTERVESSQVEFGLKGNTFPSHVYITVQYCYSYQ